ncbi:MAG: hypothetical protein JST94_06945 [Bacteroidetes bacterium]|nr:hypothetical protein [Bacteroidota bacterium]MBS1641750.1 hypothetical protein [Bacteroidota bacterium]MBS1671174.1 hypothetical protein [Bacteroidota bacterium]
MKKILLLIAVVFGYYTNAQVATNIRPAENAKQGEFSEWEKVNVSFDDNTSTTIEYRVVFVKRFVIGCHYNIEVKNTGNEKLHITLQSAYHDKLVKRNFSDVIKETLKPGKTISGRFIAQGCKKEKDAGKDDAANCFACEFGISIYAKK